MTVVFTTVTTAITGTNIKVVKTMTDVFFMFITVLNRKKGMLQKEMRGVFFKITAPPNTNTTVVCKGY